MTQKNSLLSPTLSRLMRSAVGLALGATPLLVATPAAAQEFVLQAEGAGAFWLDAPQTERFTPGLYLALRPGLSVGRVVSLQWSYAVHLAAPDKTFTENGVAHWLTTGVRLRPLATLASREQQLGGLFVDFNLGYVRTGELDRFGFDAGLGFGFQVAPSLAIGPVVRYAQVVQPDNLAGQDPNDAQLLTLGVNLSFGRPYREPVVEGCPEPLQCPPTVVTEVVREVETLPDNTCVDTDGDGLCDAEDRCPAESGPAATLGCPVDPCSGKSLVVLVQFPYDSAALPARVPGDAQTMDPVLESVGDAIAQEPSCRVCVVGHASEEGSSAYNQKLSVQRAVAVREYLVARGLGEARMPTQGQGDKCQLHPETSRLLNRRVQFIRLNEGESCPSECTP